MMEGNRTGRAGWVGVGVGGGLRKAGGEPRPYYIRFSRTKDG